jgi:hypothetical protein
LDDDKFAFGPVQVGIAGARCVTYPPSRIGGELSPAISEQ